MPELMKTLIFLNIQGSALVVLLILLKYVICKIFSGKWQRNLWIFAAVMFLIPVWKVVPENAAPPIILPYYSEEIDVDDSEVVMPENTKEAIVIPDVDIASSKSVVNIYMVIWCAGIITFLTLNVVGYITFLIRKRKVSTSVADEIFINILQSMGIKQKIKLRQCKNIDSPMLTGVFFPVVYMPEKELIDSELLYVYSHELTHYKHKDLPVKWFACIVNAINWFNPLMYIVMKNLNEACEIYCDEIVTQNMNEECKKTYMNTILNLLARK